MSRDAWDALASKHLMRHIMTGTLKGRDYAPDQTPELSKRGQSGPLSAQVTQIMQRHANLWADDMRTAARAEIDLDQTATFNDCMAAADAEVDRFLAGHKAGRAA